MNEVKIDWKGHILAIWREGISVNAYANRHGLEVKKLYYWQKRFQEQGMKADATPASSPAFATVSIATTETSSTASIPTAPPTATPQTCTFIFPSGLRLELANLPSPEWLSALYRTQAGL